jgi:hypothetical protein
MVKGDIHKKISGFNIKSYNKIVSCHNKTGYKDYYSKNDKNVYVVDYNCSVNVNLCKYGCTPLVLAAKTGKLELVKWLVGKGADINHPKKKTALSNASNFEIFKYLFNKGAKIGIKNKRVKDYLFKIQLDNEKKLKRQREKRSDIHKKISGFNIKSYNKIVSCHKKTGYKDYYSKNDKNVYVVDYNCSVNVNLCKYGYTPLVLAAKTGKLELVKWLVGKGVDVNHPKEKTALSNASNFEIFKYLFNKGAKIGIKNKRVKDYLLKIQLDNAKKLKRQQRQCPVTRKITTVIYSPENAKLKRYLEYFVCLVQKQNKFLDNFQGFLSKYYKCVCPIDKPFSFALIIFKSTIDYQLPKINVNQLETLPPSIRHKTEILWKDKITRIVVPNSPTTKNYMFLGKELINDIRNCKKRYLVITLGLTNSDKKNETGHGNSLIFDIENQTIIRFEPHGTDVSIYSTSSIDKCMEELVKLLKYKRYVSPVNFCPPNGTQHFEGNSKYDTKDGFCGVFSFLFICYVLDFPQYSLTQIHSMMFQGEHKNPNINQNDVVNKRINVSLEVRLFANLIIRLGNGEEI